MLLKVTILALKWKATSSMTVVAFGRLLLARSSDYSDHQSIIASFLTTKCVFRYDEEDGTLWLWEWGFVHPNETCAAW